MPKKVWMVVTVVALVIIIVIYRISFEQSFLYISHMEESSECGDLMRKMEKVILERNEISKLLNRKQQKLGQLECEAQNSKAATSDAGGWCKNASTEGGGEHLTDKELATALAEFFKGKYVASFGDGPGRYKQLLLDSGKVKGYDAYDGAPFCEDTSEGRVQFLDLTLPQYGLPVYDWVMSLEVAEHIPKQYESNFIDNVVRHAREGIVLSWARLGQGGYSHVNNQPFEYVKQIMEDNGFAFQESESKHLQNAASYSWLKWNTNVYRRRTAELMSDES